MLIWSTSVYCYIQPVTCSFYAQLVVSIISFIWVSVASESNWQQQLKSFELILTNALPPMPSCVSPSLDHCHKVGGTSCIINSFSYSFIPRTSKGWNCLPSPIATIQWPITKYENQLCGTHLPMSPVTSSMPGLEGVQNICSFISIYGSNRHKQNCIPWQMSGCKLQPQPSRHATPYQHCHILLLHPLFLFWKPSQLTKPSNTTSQSSLPSTHFFLFLCCCFLF